MQEFLSTLAFCSLTMSMAALLLILLSPLLSKKYEAKWQYYAWLVIVIGFIIPIRPYIDFAVFKVDLPTIQPSSILPIGVQDFVIGTGGEMSELLMTSTLSVYSVIGYMWLAGMILVIGYHIFRHLHFMKLVNRWSEDVCDEQILTNLQMLKAEMGIAKHVHLRRCSIITSPMVIGFRTPTILLPATDFSKNELSFILAHELVHYKRKDVGYKSLVLLATAVHWFNPVVYWMTRSIALQCELSCDAEIMKNAREDTRRQYCEAIIRVIRQQSRLKTALSTQFYGGKENMKNRILSIMDERKKKSGIAIVFGVLALCVAVFIMTDSGRAANNNFAVDEKEAPTEKFEGPFESKHVVDVDVKAIANGEGVNLGQYTLEEGDIIAYNITSEGNGNLDIGFRKTDEYARHDGYLGEAGLTGNTVTRNLTYPIVVSNSLAGTYYLFVGNYEGKSLENIKGTVEIAVPVKE